MLGVVYQPSFENFGGRKAHAGSNPAASAYMDINKERIEIVKLVPDEWEDYFALRKEMLEREPTSFAVSPEEVANYSEEFWRANLEAFQEGSGKTTWFARTPRELIGMAGAYKEGYQKMGHIWIPHSVYVDRLFRGRGVGRGLMNALVGELSGRDDIKKLRLEVTQTEPDVTQQPAFRLYRSLGFEPVGVFRDEYFVNGQYYNVVQMERYLKNGK